MPAILDSLDSVEAMLALEEELEGPLAERVPQLREYFVEPSMQRCVSGSVSMSVCVFARDRSTVVFAAF